MRKIAWIAFVLAGVTLSGCGGGGGAASTGVPGPVPPDKIPFEPIASARLDVDVVSGKVTVTPLKSSADGRAIWGGDSVDVQASDLLALSGNTTVRSINLRLKNNTAQQIGAGNGVRVQFRQLRTDAAPDFRSFFTVNTAAGDGGATSTDGPALTSSITPYDVEYLPDGTILILEPLGLRRLRNGMLSGVATSVFTLSGGMAVAVDPATQKPFALVADQNGHRIRWVDVQSGAFGTLAGTGAAGDVIGAPGTAQFNQPRGVAWGGAALLVADSLNGKVKRVPVAFSGGIPVASTVTTQFTGLSVPVDVAINGPQIAVAEQGANRVRITQTGTMLIGSGVSGFLGGTAATARFSAPCGLAWAGGVLYVSNSGTGSISAIWKTPDADPNDPDSYTVALMAGTGAAGYGDGTGLTAQFTTQASGLAARGGSLLVADRGNRRLRAVESSGPLLDEGFGAFPPTGRAMVANATGHIGLAITPPLIPFIARQTTLAPGVWTDFGQVDFQHDQGVARFTMTLLIEAGSGTDIGLDSVSNNGMGSGSPNNHVQNIIPISTMAMDGPVGQAAASGQTIDIDADLEGNLYILDGRTVRRFDARTQVLSTIAGARSVASTVDGSGVAIRFDRTTSLAVSGSGDLILVTQSNHVVRALVYNGFGNRNDVESYSCTTVLGALDSSGNIAGVGLDTRFNNPTSVGLTDDGSTAVIGSDTGSMVMMVSIIGPPNNPLSYKCSSVGIGINEPVLEADIDNAGGLLALQQSPGSQPILYKVSVPSWASFTLMQGATSDNDQTAVAFGATGLATDSLGRVLFVSKGTDATPRSRIRRISSAINLLSTVAGSAGTGSTADGPSDKFLFRQNPSIARLAPTRDGTVYALFNPGGISRISRIVR